VGNIAGRRSVFRLVPHSIGCRPGKLERL
jgi:hypothetical protein